MEIVVGIVVSIVARAARYTVSPIKNHIKYLCNHENAIQSLKAEVDSLKDARERVQHSVDDAKRNGEEIERDVDKWLTTVDKKIAEELERVMQDEEKAKKKCFVGICPNVWARYKLSIEVEKEAKVVAELLQQGRFDRVSYRAAPRPIMAAYVKGFESFESRTMVLNGIMEALKDASISIIGVHGMGGVGKTTLVKEVARQVNEAKLFDSVVIATVTQSLDIEKIQNQIADLVGYRFEEQSLVGRALGLRERLKKEKKILVILDDIWERLDLQEIGVPSGDDHQGCKILLTSRDLNVLSNGMYTQKNFEVGILTKEEAWNLFKKIAGDCVDSYDLHPTAIEVAKKCAGLPIAIATVASALRNKSSFEWKNALCELKSPASRNLKGVTTAVHSAIELSYNYLGSEEVKFTFLLASLLGHNSLIEDLLRYVIGLSLFHGVNTIEEARNRVLTVVTNLKASWLLLDSYNSERFDIHDVVWDVALSIALRDHHMFVLREGELLKEWPEKEMMNTCSAVNFRYPRIMTELPDEMESSHLSFFCMESAGPLKIPANFFRGTKRLKVLDMARMQFSPLPVSINVLTNLHTLCLNECALEDITIVGKLKKLEILSLAHSDIKALPNEVAQLTQLRLLDLSNCTKLQIIPPNVLASLSKLEELYMENSFDQWEGEALGNERTNASLEELKHLSHLTTLYACIPNAEIIPKDLFIETLDRYRISIGGVKDWSNKYEYSRTLKFKLCTSIYMDRGVKTLLKKAEDLYLDQLKGVKNVLSELNDGEGFPHLKKLHIQNGMEVQYITVKKFEFSQLQSMTLQNLPQLVSFCSEETKRFTSPLQEGDISFMPLPLFNKQFVFPDLKSLQLSFINAQRIWHSQISETSFCVPNLTSLIIEGCGKLEHLFSPSIARSLVQLKRLEIEQCKCLRDVIFSDGIEEEKNGLICFPQLHSLIMKDLQNLIEFCSASYKIEFPSLKILKIDSCPELKEFINESKTEEKSQLGMQALFNDKVAMPCLERLTISHLKNVKMIFDNQLLPGSFWKLQEMSVQFCDELLAIFSSNIIGVFQSLEQLWVHNCESVEVIFELGGLNIQEAHVIDSQLREMWITSLPKLKHVWDRDPQGIHTFQNLRKVQFRACGSLKNLFPASIAKDLPRLEDLRLHSCGVEEIVSAELGDQGMEVLPISFKFPQVSSLVLSYLKELRCFYPGQHTTAWPVLKKLETDFSTLLKIVGSQHPGNGIQQLQVNGINGQPLFLAEEVIPQLEELRLKEVDNIAMICDGQFPADFFHHIKVFQLSGSLPGSANFPNHFLQRFYNLETLEISCCDFKDVDSITEEPGIGMLSRIRKITLSSSFNLKHIWKKDLELGCILPNLEIFEVKWCDDLINFGPSSSSFKSLTTLKVKSCKMMINLVTPSVIENLVQLTTMTISYCTAMTEIVANEETYNGVICFSKLKYLQLEDLQSLTSFCPGNYTFKLPFLEELIVSSCPHLKIFSHGVLSTPQLQRVKETTYDRKGRWAGDLNITIQQLYTEKVGYCGLYHLKLSDTFVELMEIWNRNPQEIVDFKYLERIEVCNLSSLKYIFTPSMVLSLRRLSNIKVKECNTIEAVVTEQGVLEEATADNLLFPILRSIKIDSCSNLTSFYLGCQSLEFSSLQSIDIINCPKMATLASSLGHGELDIAQFFSDKVFCPKLDSLHLSSVNLQKIWHDQPLSSLYVDKLTYLEVNGCHNLKYLFPSFMVKHFVQLQSLDVLDCKMMEQVIFLQGSTEEERMSHMLFPKLEFLWLKDLSKLSRFCSEGYFEFPCLTSLTLINCPLVTTFISISENVGDDPLIHQSNLEVSNSALFNDKVIFPSLEMFTIKGMRDCRKIWPDQLIADSFSKLNDIEIEDCETLVNIFPFDMMKKLEELQKLQIVNCNSLEEIVDPQGLIDTESHSVTTTQSVVVQTVTKFVFPKVTHLRLDKLPKLKTFYAGIHAIEWTSLKKMEVIDCQQVELFALESAGFSEISNQQPLFRVNEVTFPTLEELRWKQNDIVQGTWYGEVLSTGCFREIKVLELICIPKKSTALPYSLIHSLPKLEKLVVDDASFLNVFEFAGLSDEERHALALTQLSELRLSKLPELTHLWEKEFQPIAVFRNLRILQVQECCKLRTLVPSSLSFDNLTTLEVSRCHGFVHLIACSIAKSLVLLERMSITDCEMMEEIIECGAEEIQGGIVFTRLKYLELSCLPSLASFCLGDHNFEFPTLRKVIVSECPKLMTFCGGGLSTPKLKQVQLTRDDEEQGRWEGDLKTTVKQIFEEMNVQTPEVTDEATLLPS